MVNSPRQLWSVAGYLDMVMRRRVRRGRRRHASQPKLPVTLVPMLFGERDTHRLDRLADRRVRPAQAAARSAGELLVAGRQHTDGADHHGRAGAVAGHCAMPSPRDRRAARAARTGHAPHAPVRRDTAGWQLPVPAGHVLYVDGQRSTPIDGGRHDRSRRRAARTCLSLTRSPRALESLHSPDRPASARRQRRRPAGRTAVDRTERRPLSRARLRYRQRQRPDQHRHHRGGEDAGAPVRGPTEQRRHDRDAAQRGRAATPRPWMFDGQGGVRMPLRRWRTGFNMSDLDPLRALHRRQGRQRRACSTRPTSAR